ncbi:MAG: hypothetical protein R6V27_09940 [Balneolaceae bacterium]
MKKVMKPTISTLAALLMIFAGSSAIAQQSDYQIQQDFRAEVSSISEQIDQATTSEDVSEITSSIDELEADFSGYEDLLNAALYPDTFEDHVGGLRDRLSGTQANIETVEQLNERVEELQAEIDEMRNELTQMNEDSDALRERMERSAENERRLSGLVSQYRQNLEERDEFVSDFLDNLLSRYEAMDSETQSEIAEASEGLEDDPLALVETILSEYINQSDRDSNLEAPDFVRMRAQHAYFDEVWDRIGERMANAYAPDNPVESEQEITDLLEAWQASIDNKLWNALSTAFNQNGIELPAFTSNEAFFNALTTFVDDATETAQNQNEEADYELYESFSEYWNNTVKSDWGQLLVNGNVLTQEQIAAVDVRLGEWGRSAEPVSNLMFILFMISLAVIIGLIVLLVTKK